MRILLVIVITITDLVTAFILLCRGTNFRQNLIISTYYFNIYTSLLELWIFSLVRFSLTSGFILGLTGNIEDSIPRMKKMYPPVLLLSVTMWSYTIIKLLLYFEPLNAQTDDPWFWSMFSWSLIMSVLFYVSWHLLSTLTMRKEKNVNANINGGDDERESLLGASKEETDEEKEKINTKASIARMLALSKPDWPILLTAFIFLTLCSLGEFRKQLLYMKIKLLVPKHFHIIKLL